MCLADANVCAQVSAPEIVSGMSGESEAKLRQLFNEARELAPCIVFIGESCLGGLGTSIQETGVQSCPCCVVLCIEADLLQRAVLCIPLVDVRLCGMQMKSTPSSPSARRPSARWRGASWRRC